MLKTKLLRIHYLFSCLIIWSVFVIPVAAQSTTRGIINRPGDSKPKLPEYTIEPSTEFKLPPAPSQPGEGQLSSEIRVFSKQIRIIGSTVFSTEELNQLKSPYENRYVSNAELLQLRHKISLFYVDHGYVNSGAILPDQKIRDGIVQIDIIEGRLGQVAVSGNSRLRNEYISQRVAKEGPLNVSSLSEQLQLLNQSPHIKQINAQLLPGADPGDSILALDVIETDPLRIGFAYSNVQSPSIGGNHIEFGLSYGNLSGWGDRLNLNVGRTKGLIDGTIAYSIPVNAKDTLLTISYDQSYSEVIEEPFSELDIENRSRSVHVGIDHPFYKTLQSDFTMGLALDWRRNKSQLLDTSFSFEPGSGEPDKSEIAVVRWSQQWLTRSREQVFVFRSTFSSGIDAFDASIRDAEPDGRFFSWLGQLQLARRVGLDGAQAILRIDAQLTDDELLSMEKFSIGGVNSVRGYRNNQLVRDKALIASLEYRLPLRLGNKRQNPGSLQLLGFIDYGHGWNNESTDLGTDELYSVGLGLHWAPTTNINAKLYWGHALNKIDNLDEDLQDRGIHFHIQVGE